MKIILFKLWSNYTESNQRTIFPHSDFYLDNSLWNQWRTLHCTKKLLLYAHHRACIGESIRESALTVLQR